MNKPKCYKLPLVFTITYTPHVRRCHIRKALLKHWGPIEGHPELSKVFPDQPLIAYKRAKNLRDHLVKSKFTSLRERDEENDLDDASLDAPISGL